MLSITDISIRIAGRLLIDSSSAQIVPGARVGLIGRNGAGKSTLFHAIRGELPLEAGTITIPPRWRVGSLAQEAPNGPESLIDVVLKADFERPGFLHRRPGAALLGILRRLAHARGACGNVVLGPRSSAAGRAHQLSR